MPNLNGIKAAGYIRTQEDSQNKDKPFILISAFVPELRNEGNIDFASVILDKPVELTTLIKHIRFILGMKLKK
jgi:hypothetical protein